MADPWSYISFIYFLYLTSCLKTPIEHICDLSPAKPSETQ